MELVLPAWDDLHHSSFTSKSSLGDIICVIVITHWLCCLGVHLDLGHRFISLLMCLWLSSYDTGALNRTCHHHIVIFAEDFHLHHLLAASPQLRWLSRALLLLLQLLLSTDADPEWNEYLRSWCLLLRLPSAVHCTVRNVLVCFYKVFWPFHLMAIWAANQKLNEYPVIWRTRRLCPFSSSS